MKKSWKYNALLLLSFRPVHTKLVFLTYFGEFFKNCLVLFAALHERPFLLVEVLVELLQHGSFLLCGNVHIILHCVQGPQHQVEDADCWSTCTRDKTTIDKSFLLAVLVRLPRIWSIYICLCLCCSLANNYGKVLSVQCVHRILQEHGQKWYDLQHFTNFVPQAHSGISMLHAESGRAWEIESREWCVLHATPTCI